ncbi:MAG TPA: hypothetical protein VGF91_01205 [Solirubrobacteraceae bacterium]
MTLVRMWEVSREAATAGATGLTLELGGLVLFAGGALEVLDVLVCDGLGDGGMHSAFLSALESTAVRMS